jgi:hypothetical protein
MQKIVIPEQISITVASPKLSAAGKQSRSNQCPKFSSGKRLDHSKWIDIQASKQMKGKR